MGNFDHDAVLRARVLLLGSERPDLLEEVHAYRVLAEVSPNAYLPKLAGALVSLSHRAQDPEVELALCAEAVDTARRIDAGVTPRTASLCHALDAYQRVLFAAGRRAEGRAACEEMAEAGRKGRLANVLAEEGRFQEAAKLDEGFVRNGTESSFWSTVEWAANLEGAGRHEEAVHVFGELVDEARREAAAGGAASAALTGRLLHLALMQEAAGRRTEATATRREALTVLEELAAPDRPKGDGMYLAWWSTLFLLSGRTGEPAATPEAPAPPFGTHGMHWSRDVTRAFLDALPQLEEEAARLREAGRLSALADVRRRICIRVVRRHGDHHYRLQERLGPYFDEGVALARQLSDDPARLARALTDRATFRLVTGAFEPAYADLAEAVALLEHNPPARS
ncbi:hypothetical protein ABZO31_27055 [Streptomyces sp. HUAS MG47]|uniref:hypothetical protein n=1 Tax=Streptomyces solicamelliae TaxID=3231716 RepID=UPI003877F4FE